jgi:hypothetical protein
MNPTTNPAPRTTNPALRNRKLAGVLALVYVALFAIAGYLESIRIESYWPTWLFAVGSAAWVAIMLVLPFVVVRYFFGLDLSLLWQALRRFSLRSMLLWWVPYICVLIWYFTQMHWSNERDRWRVSNRAAARSTQGEAPLGLRLVGEEGESRIEIKYGTQEQIAKATAVPPGRRSSPCPRQAACGKRETEKASSLRLSALR